MKKEMKDPLEWANEQRRLLEAQGIKVTDKQFLSIYKTYLS